MVLAQKQKYRSMGQNKRPEINPRTYGQLIYDKDVNGEKTDFSINCSGKTGQLHVKRMKLECFLMTYTKIN